MYTKLDIDPANLDANGIAENQTSAGAGNVTLNGALCDLGTAAQFDIGDAYSDGVGGVQLVFDSAGDISGVTFTITGKDENGDSQTEDVTGVDTSSVTTTKYWSQVTQIASDGAIGSNLFIGTVTGTLTTKWIPLNWRNEDSGAGAIVSGLSGTCQFDIDVTYTDIQRGNAPTWFTDQSNKSADLEAVLPVFATAMRLKFDSYSNGAELQLSVRQS